MCVSLLVITWDPLDIAARGFLLDSDGVQDTLPPPHKYGHPWPIEYFKLKAYEKMTEARSL